MPARAITVVTIDDHPLVREGIKRQLETDQGLRLVGEGSCGDDVLRLAEALQPDVMLLDIELPQSADSHGKNFKLMMTLPVLQQRFPKTCPIIISQHLSQGLLRGAFTRGVRGYLLKDDILTLEVNKAIRQVVEGHHYFSHGVTARLAMNQHSRADLTPRQKDVLMSLVENPNSSYIQHAELLGINEGTLRNYLQELKRQLNASTVLGCVVEAVREGIVTLPS